MRKSLRELGISVGTLQTGHLNLVTDVPGLEIGHSTIVVDDPSVQRSGVTVIWPGTRDIWTRNCFVGSSIFNGFGEMTGLCWINEQGLLGSPIAMTCTQCVGSVRDAICSYASKRGIDQSWDLPVVGETWDGWLSDPHAMPVTEAMVHDALDGATTGSFEQGCVGGGTGMICHGFKGGIGSASRVVEVASQLYTVGCIVQANQGRRELLRVDGYPVGRHLGYDAVPGDPNAAASGSSILVILATDAPLLPIQCQRLARRAATGMSWVGGIGDNSSGDIFLAFSTANEIERSQERADVRMLAPDNMSPLFLAAAEATEEAILNALAKAHTMTGYEGRVVHELPYEPLLNLLSDRGRARRG